MGPWRTSERSGQDDGPGDFGSIDFGERFAFILLNRLTRVLSERSAALALLAPAEIP